MIRGKDMYDDDWMGSYLPSPPAWVDDVIPEIAHRFRERYRSVPSEQRSTDLAVRIPMKYEATQFVKDELVRDIRWCIDGWQTAHPMMSVTIVTRDPDYGLNPVVFQFALLDNSPVERGSVSSKRNAP